MSIFLVILEYLNLYINRYKINIFINYIIYFIYTYIYEYVCKCVYTCTCVFKHLQKTHPDPRHWEVNVVHMDYESRTEITVKGDFY